MKRLSLIVLLVALPLSAGPRRRSATVPPPFPPCSVISGIPAVTFTRDEGRTLTPIAAPMVGTGYTWGVAALDTPGTLLAWHKLTLSRSVDDGCSWTPVASASSVEFPPSITAGRGGVAYIWSENRQYIARYDSRGLENLKAPGAILGIGVDRMNADRVRAGDSNGNVWQSTDGGATWDPIGKLELTIPLAYRFSFDPADLDHVVAGTATTGAFVSRDGGRKWTQASIGTGFNVFNLVISPVDGETVWAMALEESMSDTSPAFGRHVYRSTDGGATYRPVVDQSPAVQLINGPLMVAHPVDANVLYFVFGSYYQNYGTDLFRYDASTRTLTVEHNAYHGIDAISFSRRDPRVMYLGLEQVHVQ